MMRDFQYGKVLADRFQLEERIGEGGFSVLYRARQLLLDRPVVVKVLAAHVAQDPWWVERFRHLARVLSKVTHPNVVEIIDATESDGLHYVVMEFLEGQSLRAELDRVRALPPKRALRIMAQVSRALDAVHDAGMVHRDVKPETVQLCTAPGEPEVKLLFSMVAKLLIPGVPSTRPGVVLGTPWYMAPEQVRGAPLDRRTDVYAAGVMLYEILAGHRPFEHAVATEVALMHLRNPPPMLPEWIPGLVGAIVDRALQKDPNHRYPTAEAFAKDCEAALGFLG